MFAAATVWAAEVGGVQDSDYQKHIDSGHVWPMPLTEDGKNHCDACIRASMQDIPAFNFFKGHITQNLEGINSDLLDLGQAEVLRWQQVQLHQCGTQVKAGAQ